MNTTKTCERCGNTYSATETHFGFYLRSPDRLKAYCRRCAPAVAADRRKRKNERSKAWAAANREKVRESNRKSYEKTRRTRLEYLRRYRAENKERLNQYAREYRRRKRLDAQGNE